MEADRPECETAFPAAVSSGTRGRPSIHMEKHSMK